jgi:hypothetical protein
VFCEECSAKTCAIPQLNMPTPVRVCDECFITIKRTNFDFNLVRPRGTAPADSSDAPRLRAAGLRQMADDYSLCAAGSLTTCRRFAEVWLSGV